MFRDCPAPRAHLYRLGLVTWRYQVRIPIAPDICHRGCAYAVLQTVQRPGVYSAAYRTVHYKEPLKSFELRVWHSPGFGLPSVSILPWLSRKRRKAIFIYGRSQCARDGAWRIGRAPDCLDRHVRNQLILLGAIREISLFLQSQCD